MKTKNQEIPPSLKVYPLPIGDGKSRSTFILSDTLESVLAVRSRYIFTDGVLYFPSVGEWIFSEDGKRAVYQNDEGELFWGVLP